MVYIYILYIYMIFLVITPYCGMANIPLSWQWNVIPAGVVCCACGAHSGSAPKSLPLHQAWVVKQGGSALEKGISGVLGSHGSKRPSISSNSLIPSMCLMNDSIFTPHIHQVSVHRPNHLGCSPPTWASLEGQNLVCKAGTPGWWGRNMGSPKVQFIKFQHSICMFLSRHLPPKSNGISLGVF